MSNNIKPGIRTYGKGELASLYLPNIQPASARRTLRNWINKNIALKNALIDAGYTNDAVLLTPIQVEIIFEYLGMP